MGPVYEVGYTPENASELIDRLHAAGADVDVEPAGRQWWAILVLPLVIVALLVGVGLMLRRRARGSGPAGTFGRARAKRSPVNGPRVTFRDVAGVDEAVEELHEIKEFLREPEEVPGARRADPEGRAALRPAGHRQDAAGPRGRG